MKVAIYIDYDNLHDSHKTAGILDIVTRVLMKLPVPPHESRGICEVRLYGGWYEGEEMSQLSQKLSVKVQNDFPKLIRIPSSSGQPCIINTTVELALALLEEPAHHLFNTYRKKGKPRNVRVETPENIGCKNIGCALPAARKLLKTGNCPIDNCSTIRTPLVYRHEQKIVDTMLTCDLIYIAQKQYDYLLLISEDDDFLPPIRTILLRGLKVIRVHPRLNPLRTSVSVAGIQLVEMEI